MAYFSFFAHKHSRAFVFGLFTGALCALVLPGDSFGIHQPEGGSGPVDEYHTHADFLIVANDEKISLAEESYMSIATRILHRGVHLHDNNGDVIHFHEPGITLPTFLQSIGFALTDTCLTTPRGAFCVADKNVLRLYVNGADKTTELPDYVPTDEDQILLYYGIAENPDLGAYHEAVTDDACIYSGTCPERGTAPRESCGLFCEL